MTTHPTKRKKNGKKASCPWHIRVWIEANGEIPDGYVIHHINGEKFDNRIENLKMVTRSEHRKLHPLKNQKEIMNFVRSKR